MASIQKRKNKNGTKKYLNKNEVNKNIFIKFARLLLQAIATKKLDVAKLLLDHGANVDMSSKLYSHSFYSTPLLKAVEDNFLEGVLLLLR